MGIGGWEATALIGLDTLVPLFLGYALGSIPFGLILTRASGAGDIRKVGSGNIGATNVLRTGRKGLAAATLLFDALKGFAPVILFRLHSGMGKAVAAAGASWPSFPCLAELPGRQGRGHLYRRGDRALFGRSFFAPFGSAPRSYAFLRVGANAAALTPVFLLFGPTTLAALWRAIPL
jgi:glycerol-3-phosphate acyltransferase PlsY